MENNLEHLACELEELRQRLAHAEEDKVRSETALRQSEARFRAFFDNSPCVALLKDPEGRLVYGNVRLKSLLSTEDRPFLGKTDYELFPFEIAQQLREHDATVLATGQTLETIEHVPTLSGELRSWLVMKFLVPDEAGKVFLGGVAIDITERERAEKELVRSESQYRNLVETTHDLIWSVDTEGRWVFLNRLGALATYGYEPEEMLGRPFMEFESAERSQKDLETFSRIKSGKPIFNYETEHIRKDGTPVSLSFNAIPFLSPEGQLLGTTGTARNITERKRAEEERRKLEAQVQHAQKLESLGVLAGGIAHDFNNLLTVILGYATLAHREVPPGAPRDWIDQVIAGSRRAAELAQQMLAYSGKGRFVTEVVNLSEVVQAMLRLLEVAISKKCVLHSLLTPDLPPCEVDVTQVRQVVMNLVMNASDAIAEQDGVITISTGVNYYQHSQLTDLSPGEQLPEGRYVFLEVQDSGCGMSAETKARVFDPFFTTKFTGRGLGMSAVLGIIRGHRGGIQIRSELGKGTTCQVLFPVSSQAEIGPESCDTQSRENAWRGSGLVLVVDDDPTVRTLTKQILETMGFNVLVAKDGREGVDMFRKQAGQLRLVLLDLVMPHLNGDAAFREMKQIRDDIPTLVLSGYNEQEANTRFTEQEGVNFVQKPYEYDDLVAAIRKALRE
ncbi:MAG: PAS domain S-box protein [Gemmataceae bacterium]